MEPASIRYKNPGAMWGGARADKWGATDTIQLKDGTGQGNNIAVFPTFVHGAAAQFDLWRSNYCNMTLDAAVRKWSGGNSSPQYLAFLKEKTGLLPTTMITPTLLAIDTGWKLMKAQAQWEAGKPYPMTDAEWKEAQAKCFGTTFKPKVSTSTKVVIASTTTAGAVVAGQEAYSYGMSITQIIAIVVFVVFVGVAAFLILHNRGE